jgi:hypothetical protein
MNLRLGILFCLTMVPITFMGQSPVDVCESTVKVAPQSTDEYLCGLAAGDQLLFSFDSEKGGKIDRIEILEYPSTIRFSDYRTSGIKQKTLTITHSGIYLFRFGNSDKKEKVIKYTIRRIPAGEATAHFNSTVYWTEKQDTTDVHTENQVVFVSDTLISNLVDKVVNIPAWLNTKSNKMSFGYSLPPKAVAYSYYIGVNQAGNKVFNDATAGLLRSCGSLASVIPGYGPLAALALNGTSFFTTLSGGESVEYWITDAANAKLFGEGKPFRAIREGNVVNDFSRITTPLKGDFYVCLKNGNKLQSITVTVKVAAVSLRERKIIYPVKKYTVVTLRVPYLRN